MRRRHWALPVITAGLLLALARPLAAESPPESSAPASPPESSASEASEGPEAAGAAESVESEGDVLEEPGRDKGEREARRRRWRMDAEEVDAARRIVGVLYPELAERLEALYAKDPEEARETLERRFPRVRFLVRLEKHDPEMYLLRMNDIRLERQIDHQFEQLGEAREAEDEAAYTQARAALETLVTEHFDVRHQIREREIIDLERRLAELKKRWDEQSEDRAALIQQRLDELAGEAP